MVERNQTPGTVLPNAFDAVWAAALAINSTINTDLPPETFTYNNAAFGRHLFDMVTDVQFYGANVSWEIYTLCKFQMISCLSQL